MTDTFRFESWRQAARRVAQELVASYGCTPGEARGAVGSPHQDCWWYDSLVAIQRGATPPQWWVNQQSGRGRCTRWEQWLQHNPDQFDRLVRAGLSLYHPKAHLGAG